MGRLPYLLIVEGKLSHLPHSTRKMSMNNLSHKQIAATALRVALGSNAARQASSGAAAYTFTATDLTKVHSVRLHCTTAPSTSEDLTIKIKNPSESTAHEVLLLQQDMQATTDIFFTDAIFLAPGDELHVEWANTDGVAWGITAINGGV